MPLVIISQPLPAPITGQSQSSPSPQEPPEEPDHTAANANANTAATSQTDLQTEVVLEMNQISTDDQSPGGVTSADVTSLPVTNGQPASEAPPPPEEDAVVVVVVSVSEDRVPRRFQFPVRPVTNYC